MVEKTQNEIQRLYLASLAACIIAGTMYFVKYYLVAETLRFLPAILSGSTRTFTQTMALFLAVVTDLCQLWLLWGGMSEPRESDGKYNYDWIRQNVIVWGLWIVEFVCLAVPTFVPNLLTDNLEIRATGRIIFENFASTVNAGSWIFAIVALFLIYAMAVLPEVAINYASKNEKGSFGPVLSLVIVVITFVGAYQLYNIGFSLSGGVGT